MCADEWRSLSKSSSFSLVGKTMARSCSCSCTSAVADMKRARSIIDDLDDVLKVGNAVGVEVKVEVDTAALVA
jgi:hypothetical protein